MQMSDTPPRTMVSVVMMVVTLLLAASGPGLCEGPAEYDDYEPDGCHPEEADHCFLDVNQNLLCNLGKPVKGRNCTKRDAQDLCAGMSDALACCEDILDSCTEGEGHDIFEVWLRGLRGVHQHLCRDDGTLALIRVLLQGSKCFRLKRFLNCVEDRANLTHMADLLTTELDLHECNKIQVAVGACIEDSEKNRKQCQGTSRAVTEALTAFFTSTACGQVPPPSPPPQPPPPLPPCSPSTGPGSSDNNNNNNNNSSSTTINNTTNNNSTNNEDNTKNNTTNTNTTTNSATTNSTTTNNNTRKSNPKDTSSTTTTTTTTTSKAAPQVACQQKDLNTSGTPMASTVVVTVLVTLVLMGLAAMLLLKKGVLVIRTDLDRRLISLNDEDGNSAYDRF